MSSDSTPPSALEASPEPDSTVSGTVDDGRIDAPSALASEPPAAATPSDAPVPPPAEAPSAVEPLVALALSDLRERRAALESEIQDLEGRRDQLNAEIQRTFTGQSEAIAKRVRGFQDYLVTALQALAASAEQAQLVSQPLIVQPSALDQRRAEEEAARPQTAPAAAGLFSQDEAIIRDWLRSFQGQPDFSADPWHLRRTLDAEGAALLEEWFLRQGGRGAQPSRGTRHRNLVVIAAAITILGDLYGDRFQTLVLASRPERLGEWRRGLQDCLGLSREDFGPNSGIVLFERPEALVERADRLEEQEELPFIVIDSAERAIETPVLQFPLWLAFAGTPIELAAEDELY
ncbi:MAG: DUF3086 domain-containing protein [Cyanobacteriota bacterium]|nr:DUF3086 domain-containing protein [Cyanobacteriota bacterium]